MLEKMINAINADFFDGELPMPIVTVQSRPGTYGHCSVSKIWKRKDDEAFELNIAAEVLDAPIEEIIDTIIHELCHIYCRLHDIRETSRGGSYHNGRFRKVAEAHGLTCVYDPKYGWNTTPGDNLIEYALQKDWSEILISRATMPRFLPPTGAAGSNGNGTNGGKRTSSTRKLICRRCGQSVRATRKVNILCGDCLAPMVEV